MDSRLRRPLHNRHSGPRAGIQGWEFRIEPHVYSAQYGLLLAVMQRSPCARTTGEEGRFAYPSLRLVGSWVVWRGTGGSRAAPTWESPNKAWRATTGVAPTERARWTNDVDRAGFKPAPSVGQGPGRLDRSPVARSLEGNRRFASCPYVGVAEHDVGGQPQGLPLRREGWVPAREDTGGVGPGFANPPLRGSRRTRSRRATQRTEGWRMGMDSRLRRPLHNSEPESRSAGPQGLPLQRGRLAEGRFAVERLLTDRDGQPQGLPLRGMDSRPITGGFGDLCITIVRTLLPE